MAELLEVAQLAHQHGVAQVQVGRGGVEAGLYSQGSSGFATIFKALSQVGDADDLGGALLEQVHLFVYWQEVGHVVFQYKFRSLKGTGISPDISGHNAHHASALWQNRKGRISKRKGNHLGNQRELVFRLYDL
jgi:hypothetical protein